MSEAQSSELVHLLLDIVTDNGTHVLARDGIA